MMAIIREYIRREIGHLAAAELVACNRCAHDPEIGIEEREYSRPKVLGLVCACRRYVSLPIDYDLLYTNPGKGFIALMEVASEAIACWNYAFGFNPPRLPVAEFQTFDIGGEA